MKVVGDGRQQGVGDFFQGLLETFQRKKELVDDAKP